MRAVARKPKAAGIGVAAPDAHLHAVKKLAVRLARVPHNALALAFANMTITYAGFVMPELARATALTVASKHVVTEAEAWRHSTRLWSKRDLGDLIKPTKPRGGARR